MYYSTYCKPKESDLLNPMYNQYQKLKIDYYLNWTDDFVVIFAVRTVILYNSNATDCLKYHCANLFLVR